MSVGMSVFNEAKSLQIDDRFDTYTLNKQYVTRNLSKDNLVSGISVFSPTVLGGEIQTGNPSAQINDVTVFAFTKGVNSTENFGLQVFKADNTTAFHSGGKPLRVVDFIRRDLRKADGSIDTTSITKYYSGYTRLGVVIPNTIPIELPMGGTAEPRVSLQYPAVVINGDGSVVLSYKLKAVVSGSSSNVANGYNDFIIVDLSNY